MFSHLRDMTWNHDRYLEDQYQACQSWRKIYWRVWGLINSLVCTTCGINFSCCDFTRCPYHKENITFPSTDQTENVHKPGSFACCGTKAYKFDPIDPLFLLSVGSIFFIFLICSQLCDFKKVNLIFINVMVCDITNMYC